MKTCITYRKRPIQIEIEEPIIMSKVRSLLFDKIFLQDFLTFNIIQSFLLHFNVHRKRTGAKKKAKVSPCLTQESVAIQ